VITSGGVGGGEVGKEIERNLPIVFDHPSPFLFCPEGEGEETVHVRHRKQHTRPLRMQSVGLC